jgi:peptide/nickel transport system permease protein
VKRIFEMQLAKQSLSPGRIAWLKFRRNRTAFVSLLFIGLVSILAFAGYFIAPDHSPMANEQNVLLSTLKPGKTVKILLVYKERSIQVSGILQQMLSGKESPFSSVAYSGIRFVGDSVHITEYSKTNDGKPLSFHIARVCYPIDFDKKLIRSNDSLSFTTQEGNYMRTTIQQLRHKVLEQHLVKRTYWLGTDRLGRDVLSQIIIGARISMAVGLISVTISLLLGILLGSLAGFYGGKTDAIISWIINVIWAVPTLLLVIAITFALGKGFWQVFVAVGLTMWVEVARVVRGQILGLREKEYVEAARALGYSDLRIIFKHILPNALAPVIVISAANFASAILLEAGLSFLGLGVQPPMPSWGNMIKENYAFIILDYGYLAIIPGVAIMLVVLALMLIGNGLRDALDVKSGS